MKQAADAYSDMVEWVDIEEGFISNPDAFHQHLNMLNSKHIDELLDELDNDPQIQEWKKKDRREALARKAALWGNRGKKAIALSVVDEEGNPALDNAGAAALLSGR